MPRSNIITLERLPLIYTEEADYLSVNLHAFEVRFHKGTAGYDEIWKDGRQIVADVRWFLRGSEGKQIGIPRQIEWEVVDDYTLKVRRTYTDYLGTDYTAIFECRSDDRVKITVEGVVGKSDSYSLVWSASGIALTSVTHQKDLRKVSLFEEDIERPDVDFDYEDVYKTFGDITTADISEKADGKKTDIAFGLRSILAGQGFKVDPSLVSTSESSTATQYNFQRKLVRLSNGKLYCVYFKQLATYWQIYVKESSDNGSTWTNETRISTRSGMDSRHQKFPSIAIDSSDNLHVVWEGKDSTYVTYNQIWYAKYVTSWATPVRISTYSGMDGQDQSRTFIAVDSSDNLHVVWRGKATGYTTKTQIWYAKYVTSWATPVRISTYSGMDTLTQANPSIAVDSNDNLHVVWEGNATGYTTYYQIWYAKYTDSWATPVRISTYSGMNSIGQTFSSIAVDSNNNLHVVWRGKATGYTTNDQIWYAKYVTSWATPVRISTYSGMDNNGQLYPSIAVDTSDNLHVVWHGKATGYTDYNKVWYAKYTDSWATPECLQATGQNMYPNARWSRFPSSNIPYSGVDYVFTEGTASPYNIYWDKEDDPFPPPAGLLENKSANMAAKMMAAGLL